jgi:hypothetical protein
MKHQQTIAVASGYPKSESVIAVGVGKPTCLIHHHGAGDLIDCRRPAKPLQARPETDSIVCCESDSAPSY